MRIKSQHMNRRKSGSVGGFTLVEMAVSLIILGVLLAGMVKAYDLWLRKQKFEETYYQLDNKALNLVVYRSKRGRYPFPAPLDVDRTSPAYGYEGCTAPDPALDDGSGMVTCGAGVTIVDSQRDIAEIQALYEEAFNIDFSDSAAPFQLPPRHRVLIGTVPFRDLNLPEDFAYDSYGNRLLYAVTEIQAKEMPPYFEAAGGITVLDSDGNSRTEPEDSAEFFILSHGIDRLGGYTRSGAVYGGESCASLPGGPNQENCNNDAVFVSDDFAEQGNAARHNDDLAYYQWPRNLPLWVPTPGTQGDIYSLKHISAAGRVGATKEYTDPDDPEERTLTFDQWLEERPFHFDDPTVPEANPSRRPSNNYSPVYINLEAGEIDHPDEVDDNVRMWVAGTVRIDDTDPDIPTAGEFREMVEDDRDGINELEAGKIKALGYCNVPRYDYDDVDNDGVQELEVRRNSHDCFPSKIIGGEGIRCPANEFMLGIENADADCSDENIDLTCSTQTFVDLNNNERSLQQFVVGIDNGNLICGFLPCRTQTVNDACGDSKTLDAGAHGAVRVLPGGNTSCVRTVYQCINGVWALSSTDGTEWCTCTPGPFESTGSCGACATGEISSEFETRCEPPSGASPFGTCFIEETSRTDTCEPIEPPPEECVEDDVGQPPANPCETDPGLCEPDCDLTPSCLCDASCDDPPSGGNCPDGTPPPCDGAGDCTAPCGCPGEPSCNGGVGGGSGDDDDGIGTLWP